MTNQAKHTSSSVSSVQASAVSPGSTRSSSASSSSLSQSAAIAYSHRYAKSSAPAPTAAAAAAASAGDRSPASSIRRPPAPTHAASAASWPGSGACLACAASSAIDGSRIGGSESGSSNASFRLVRSMSSVPSPESAPTSIAPERSWDMARA